MNKLNQWFENKKEYSAIFIRLIAGVHLIIGTQDNIFSWERMIEFKNFLEQFGFPFPLVSAITSVYFQFVCGILFIIGYFTRSAAIIMIFNFIVAIIMVHLGTTYQGTFPALFMLFGSLFLLFQGAGKFSIDNYLKERKK